jgi:competence protein ComEC
MSTSIAIAVALGAAAGVFLDVDWLWPARWLLALSLFAAFILTARGYVGHAIRFALAAGFAACVILGAEAQYRAVQPPVRQLLEDQLGGFAIDTVGVGRHDTLVEIEGRLLADAAITPAGANLRLRLNFVRLDGCPVATDGGVSVTVAGGLIADAASGWRAGRIVRMPAVLRRPARYLNHGVFDQELLLARRGIALVGTVKSAALVQVVERGPWYDEWASATRAVVRSALARHVSSYDAQSGAVAIAILIGDRGSLDPNVERRLQEAGTYHVIAISGGNIAIVAGLVIALLWAGGIRGGWAATATIAVLLAYAHIAGSGPSVMRATLMAAVYLSLRIIDQRTAPRHAMAVTIAAILLASPLAIADVGLWLTFGATAAIIAGTMRLALPASGWLKAPMALIVASVCAEIVLVPVTAFVFQRVTVAGLVVNLAAVPSMAIVQVAGMITAAADSCGLTRIAGWAGLVSHLGVRGLIDSAVVVDAAPWMTWRVPSPPLALMVAYYALLVAALIAGPFTAATRLAMAIAAAGLFLWIAVAPHTLARRFGDGKLHLSMLDVGQGDSILATLPNGRTVLVDTGGVSIRGDFDVGDRVIGPALRARGISRLDYLAITHGDPDHIGGSASLVRDFTPMEIWYGVFVNNHQPTVMLQEAASHTRSTWRWLQRGDRLDLGGVELRVHHPPQPDWERQKVRNDDSLVMELRFGKVSILLTGDISREIEHALMPTLDLLPTVVLKSPHHGSGTSSSAEFVEAIRPHIVLIGVGRANPYGHPVPHVLERYTDAGAKVLRTDHLGQIDLVTDGETVSATAFVNTKDTKNTKSFYQKVPMVPRVSNADARP